jgi:hypothetical protein
MRPFVRSVLVATLSTLIGIPAVAQVIRLPGTEVGGLGGAAGTIHLLSQDPVLHISPGVSLEPSQTFSGPKIQDYQLPQNATPDEGATQVLVSPPVVWPIRSPLTTAVARTADGGECELSPAEKEPCSGPYCLLTCAAGSCGEKESTSCEFVIDCAAEIAAEIVTGDQQCEDAAIEVTTLSTQSGEAKVEIVRLPSGTTCKPPPCVH